VYEVAEDKLDETYERFLECRRDPDVAAREGRQPIIPVSDAMDLKGAAVGFLVQVGPAVYPTAAEEAASRGVWLRPESSRQGSSAGPTARRKGPVRPGSRIPGGMGFAIPVPSPGQEISGLGGRWPAIRSPQNDGVPCNRVLPPAFLVDQHDEHARTRADGRGTGSLQPDLPIIRGDRSRREHKDRLQGIGGAVRTT
jgi:hypothetical protein